MLMTMVMFRVPAGQGKLEKVREFEWSGKGQYCFIVIIKPALGYSVPFLIHVRWDYLSSNMEIVTYCQKFFRCDLPSVILQKRYVKFIDNNEQNRNC